MLCIKKNNIGVYFFCAGEYFALKIFLTWEEKVRSCFHQPLPFPRFSSFLTPSNLTPIFDGTPLHLSPKTEKSFSAFSPRINELNGTVPDVLRTFISVLLCHRFREKDGGQQGSVCLPVICCVRAIKSSFSQFL